MELIIKNCWSEELRKEKINEFIHVLGEHIYEKCKVSPAITNEEFENISLDLCVTYANSKIAPYIHNVTCGTFSIIITQKAVKEINELANNTIVSV